MRQYVIYIIVLFLGLGVLVAQEDELELLDDEGEETAETGSCIPENIHAVYDKFKSDSITEMDIKLFYNFGHEYNKNKNYAAALPYLWKVFVNDTGRYARAAIRRITEASKI